MQKYGCKKLVFSSSATVYGPHNTIPYTEDMERSTTNPYGSTKMMIEEILEDLWNSDKEWSIVSLRYFNPIGAHESGLLGDDPTGVPNNLMPYIVRVAKGELEKLTVFGDDYPTIDGTGVRDYIHVTDLARGHIAALDFVTTYEGVEAINLGTGNGTSVLYLVEKFKEVNKVEVPYVIGDRRPGDLAEYYADVRKAKYLLHWESQLSIEDMCRDSWNQRNQKKGNYLV